MYMCILVSYNLYFHMNIYMSIMYGDQIPGTGGAIAAPASETLATGLEEGIEYEAWELSGAFPTVGPLENP